MSVEWVAGSPWNQWPDVHGIGGRMAVESALNVALKPMGYETQLTGARYSRNALYRAQRAWL
jgi:hypothetical protein